MNPKIVRKLTTASVVVAILSVIFAVPLQKLWQLSLSNDLYSHVILIPFVACYLAWDRNRVAPAVESKPNILLALIPLGLGLLSLFMIKLKGAPSADSDQIEDYLAYSMLAYVCFLIATIFILCGKNTIKTQIFPILFLLLITPFPVAVRESIQLFFQYTSAEVAYWFIKIGGIPIHREGLVFQMPTIVMEVAPQCSGLRSSLVLFITSLIASYLFLKSPWKRAVFVSLFVPIGILRNAIRIFILAWQCFHISPEMIDGWFHKHGGQPLFAVTLIPVFIVLWLFRRSEKRD